MFAPLRVGLTGGIASGKTMVAQRFSELGVPVIDADVAARRVVDRNSDGLARVVERFGREILQADGQLDRARLRSVIFAEPSARKDLEALLHPLIQAHMDAEASAVQTSYLIMAIPLLVEGGRARDRVDRVLVVDVPEAMQVARVVARDGGSEAQARAILSSQATRAARLAAADEVIENTGSLDELRSAVDGLHERYLQLAQQERR